MFFRTRKAPFFSLDTLSLIRNLEMRAFSVSMYASPFCEIFFISCSYTFLFAAISSGTLSSASRTFFRLSSDRSFSCAITSSTSGMRPYAVSTEPSVLRAVPAALFTNSTKSSRLRSPLYGLGSPFTKIFSVGKPCTSYSWARSLYLSASNSAITT